MYLFILHSVYGISISPVYSPNFEEVACTK